MVNSLRNGSFDCCEWPLNAGHENSAARYTLAVTLEILEQEIAIYEPLRTAAIELEAEIEAEAQAEAEVEIEE